MNDQLIEFLYRGPGDVLAHVHEGIQLADKSGYVGVGNTDTSFVCTRQDKIR